MKPKRPDSSVRTSLSAMRELFRQSRPRPGGLEALPRFSGASRLAGRLRARRELNEGRRSIDRYLASHEVRKLNLGCGGGTLLDGWLNSD